MELALTDRTLFRLDASSDPGDEARRLRDEGRLVPVELPGGVAAWTATDLEAAREALAHKDLTKDPAYWTALQDGRISRSWELIALVTGAAMLHQGGTDHRRLRGLVHSAFNRAPIEALRPRIEELTEELLDNLEAKASSGEPVDLRELFAYPLPVTIICEVLGVPDSVVTELRHRFHRLVTPQEGATGEADIQRAFEAIYGTLGELVEIKRTDPGNDLTTALIQARDDGDRLSETELVETIFLLLISGHETTINSITNTAHALLTSPDVLAAVLESNSQQAWDDVVEEGLRYSSPVRNAIMRYAMRDTEIAGVPVAKGDPVMASLVAANRDPARHTDPESFDPSRSTSREHVAFGFGAHYCLGARLAKLETVTALSALFRRYPNLTLAAEPPRLTSISLQSFASLPVRLGVPPIVGGADAGQSAS